MQPEQSQPNVSHKIQEIKICNWLTYICCKPVTSFRSLTNGNLYATLLSYLPYMNIPAPKTHRETVGERLVYLQVISESISEYANNVLCISKEKVQSMIRHVNFLEAAVGNHQETIKFLELIILLYLWSPLEKFLFGTILIVRNVEVHKAVQVLVQRASDLRKKIDENYEPPERKMIKRIQNLQKENYERRMEIEFLKKELDTYQTRCKFKQEELNLMGLEIMNYNQLSLGLLDGIEKLTKKMPVDNIVGPALAEQLKSELAKAKATTSQLHTLYAEVDEKAKKVSTGQRQRQDEEGLKRSIGLITLGKSQPWTIPESVSTIIDQIFEVQQQQDRENSSRYSNVKGSLIEALSKTKSEPIVEVSEADSLSLSEKEAPSKPLRS